MNKTIRRLAVRGVLCICVAVAMLFCASCRKKEQGGSKVPLSPGLSLIEGSAHP